MKTIVAGMLAVAFCFAQAAPEFDVVSIKPNQSGDPGRGMRSIAGGFAFRNLSLTMLIQSAYSLKPW